MGKKWGADGLREEHPKAKKETSKVKQRQRETWRQGLRTEGRESGQMSTSGGLRGGCVGWMGRGGG